ncbi:MAG: DMT family transporter [Xanthobacteraceae bacterium]|nr:DMT family transporter [Xanthobacteraceae bacterium]
MTGTLLSFSVMAIAVRELAGSLSILEILALRAFLGLLIILAIMAARPELRHTVKTHRFGLHLFRNAVHYGSQCLWAFSLLLLPLATVFALEFTMPAWTILLAPFFLGERMTPSRIGAVFFGIAGVLVIVRPGMDTFQPAALMVLAAAFGYAINIITTKKLTATDSTFAIVFWMNVIQLVLGAAFAGVSFVGKITWDLVPGILCIGTAGLFAHYCMTNAFRAGDASVVIPLDFMRIPLIAVVGWWLYGEALDVYVFAGAGLIITGILWNLRSETRRPAPVVNTAPQGAGSDPR